MRVHANNLQPSGVPRPGAFANQPKDDPSAGMSTDWSKFSHPIDTRNRGKEPSRNIVISLSVGAIRDVPAQSVVHTPIQPNENPQIPDGNRAHTDVFGDKKSGDPEARVKFLDFYKVEIDLG